MHVINRNGNLKAVEGIHTLLDGSVHNDALTGIPTRGDIIYANSTPKRARLPLGSVGQILRSDGTDAGWAGGAVLLSTATASSSATVEFTLPTGYFIYMFVWSHVQPSVDNAAFYFRTSTNGGSSFDNGASDYAWQWLYVSSAAITTAIAAGSTAFSAITLHGNVGNAGQETCSGIICILNPSNSSRRCSITIVNEYINGTGVIVSNIGRAQRLAVADVDAVRFFPSSGTIVTGNFRLYGLGKV